MRRKPVKIKIVDYTGNQRLWTIQFGPLQGTKTLNVSGLCDCDTRTITISSRLRSPLKIALTLCHEIDHATLGPILGESPVKWCDDNREVAIKKVFGI